MNLLSTIGSYIGSKISYETEMMNQEHNNNQQQAIHNNCLSAQYRLQDALFQVLRGVTISPTLCTLNTSGDLLPSGYQLTDDTTLYFFTWTKNNSNVIPTSVLGRLANKMNTAILAEQNRFYIYIQQFDYHTQSQLVQLNGILYNGFEVLECKDVGDSITLTVAFL